MLYGKNVLRYLKIGEEWTFDQGRLDVALMTDGAMFIWGFARGVPNIVRTEDKLDEEIRTLASRLLNFLCEHRYGVLIREDAHQAILARFPGTNPRVLPQTNRERRQHPLLNWSVDNPFVDLLTQGLIVHGGDLLSFLGRMEFNPDTTCNPRGKDRLEWFNSWSIG